MAGRRKIDDASKPFHCNICGNGFGRKYSMKIHIREVHDKEKNFECKICNGKFSRNYDLKGHIFWFMTKINHSNATNVRWIFPKNIV